MLRRGATFFFLSLVVVLTHALNMHDAIIRSQQRTKRLMMASTTPTIKINPRDERRRILKSENYNRMGFKEEKEDVAGMMASEFTSPLIAELRKNKGIIKRGDVTGNVLLKWYINIRVLIIILSSTVKLAEFYGFCWGVERAVAMAYESRSHFGPEQTIHITNEIIHNPQVNERLHEMVT